MNPPTPDRRTTLVGLGSLATTVLSAGCLSRFEEPESDVSIEIDGDEGAVSVDGLTFGSVEASCGIVFVPQVNMDRESWTEQAESLTGSERFGLAIDPEENRPTAIRGALKHLRSTVDVEGVVLVGASIGGEAAVETAAAAADEVDGVVALSPGGGTEHAADLRARSLFVVAEDDDERFVETTRTLHENAPDPTRLEVLPGEEHGQGLFETDRGDDLEDWIDELIDAACSDD